jgi:hypothetical protein
MPLAVDGIDFQGWNTNSHMRTFLITSRKQRMSRILTAKLLCRRSRMVQEILPHLLTLCSSDRIVSWHTETQKLARGIDVGAPVPPPAAATTAVAACR